MAGSEEFYPCADGRTVHSVIWLPKRERPRGIVQVVHGMAEYVARYDEFARFLNERGFVVAGEDHVGHGGSSTPQRLGCLPARNGKDMLLADVDALRRQLQARLGADVPYFLFGHSLGSYIVRVYLMSQAAGLSGAVICGTGHVPVGTSRAGNAVARAICALRGEDHRSRLLHSMGVGAYGHAVPSKTPNAWLSHRSENVEAYNADPLCGFMFSAGGYATVTALTGVACSEECARAIPKDLPLLFVAGAEDPVGSMGEGVRTAVAMVRDAGVSDVECTIYPGMRHEILNEDGRRSVMGDVAGWLEAHLPQEDR